MPMHFSRKAHLLAGVPLETRRSGAQMKRDATSRALLGRVTWTHLESASAGDPALRAVIDRLREEGWSPAHAVKRLSEGLRRAIARNEAERPRT